MRRRGDKIQIFTHNGDFEVIGSLAGFQARLPITLTRTSRSWLVNEAYRSYHQLLTGPWPAEDTTSYLLLTAPLTSIVLVGSV